MINMFFFCFFVLFRLFVVATDSVVEKLTDTRVKVALYVDDLTIYASGTTNTTERQMQSAIKRIEAWSRETGLQFSAAKTVSMHICRTRNRGV